MIKSPIRHVRRNDMVRHLNRLSHLFNGIYVLNYVHPFRIKEGVENLEGQLLMVYSVRAIIYYQIKPPACLKYNLLKRYRATLIAIEAVDSRIIEYESREVNITSVNLSLREIFSPHTKTRSVVTFIPDAYLKYPSDISVSK